jgi:vitamin B12 transporter
LKTRYIIGYILISCVPFIRAQELSKEYKTVEVVGITVYIPEVDLTSQSISAKEIEEFQAEDLGQILPKFAGVQVKNYGGLGGLKTFSYRGIGGQHSEILIDGFSTRDIQSGQLNLGQVQMNEVKKIEFSLNKSNLLFPAAALLSGQVLSLTTSAGSAESSRNSVTLESKYGSFGQVDEYVSLSLHKNRVISNSFFKHRQFEGSYPYSYQLGQFNYDAVRHDNELTEMYAGTALCYNTKSGEPVRLILKGKSIQQELPGAVIFYSNPFRQYLNTDQAQAQSDYNFTLGKVKFRPFTNLQLDGLEYIDSSYLNKDNLLRNKFDLFSWQNGLNFEIKIVDAFLFFGGIENNEEQLTFVHEQLRLVRRNKSSLALGARYAQNQHEWNLKFGGHYTQRQVDSTKKENLIPSGTISYENDQWTKLGLSLQAFSSYTMRLPSFNELYFGQIGNNDLEAEKAWQNQLALSKIGRRGNFGFSSTIKGYYNRISDKIVSIPSSNLFAWTIQNVDLVYSRGLDVAQILKFFPKGNYKYMNSLRLSYSLQRSTDASPSSITFGDQIAYMPVHSANIEFTQSFNKTGLRISNYMVGERFALNQNNEFNRLYAFQVLDLGIFRTFTFNEKNKIRCQFTVKNLMNQYYDFVRFFVMPGRNYLLSVKYEFN